MCSAQIDCSGRAAALPCSSTQALSATVVPGCSPPTQAHTHNARGTTVLFWPPAFRAHQQVPRFWALLLAHTAFHSHHTHSDNTHNARMLHDSARGSTAARSCDGRAACRALLLSLIFGWFFVCACFTWAWHAPQHCDLSLCQGRTECMAGRGVGKAVSICVLCCCTGQLSPVTAHQALLRGGGSTVQGAVDGALKRQLVTPSRLGGPLASVHTRTKGVCAGGLWAKSRCRGVHSPGRTCGWLRGFVPHHERELREARWLRGWGQQGV